METRRVRPGCAVYVPKGTLHAHKNVSDGLARMLVNHTPGRATSSSSKWPADPGTRLGNASGRGGASVERAVSYRRLSGRGRIWRRSVNTAGSLGRSSWAEPFNMVSHHRKGEPDVSSDPGQRMVHRGWLRGGLLLVAATTLRSGLWALPFPRSFYEDFPFSDRGWISTLGPLQRASGPRLRGLELNPGGAAGGDRLSRTEALAGLPRCLARLRGAALRLP